MQLVKPLVGIAGLALATGVAIPSLGDSGNKYGPDPSVRNCGDNDTVTLEGPSKLWPPNHKFVQEPVTITDGDGTSHVVITLTPGHDEVGLGGDGGPQNDPDWNATSEDGTTFVADGDGTATAALEVRAERSGKGDDRVYTINWMASFDNGSKMCNSDGSDADHQPFTITVPHDMRGGANWATKQ